MSCIGMSQHKDIENITKKWWQTDKSFI